MTSVNIRSNPSTERISVRTRTGRPALCFFRLCLQPTKQKESDTILKNRNDTFTLCMLCTLYLQCLCLLPRGAALPRAPCLKGLLSTGGLEHDQTRERDRVTKDL
jgi:hypothetical protein